jgi:hypothetical protein
MNDEEIGKLASGTIIPEAGNTKTYKQNGNSK